MPRLDPFIERLFSETARELRLEAGSGAVLATGQGPVALIKQALTAQQILGALAEVVPDDRREGFASLARSAASMPSSAHAAIASGSSCASSGGRNQLVFSIRWVLLW